MKTKQSFIPVILLIIGLGSPDIQAQGTTFTWTGEAGSSPWYDEGNWDANGAPNQVDGDGSGTTLGTEEEDALIVFDSEVAVNNYMPTETLGVSTDWFGSGASDHLMPGLQLRNGTLNLGNSNAVWWHYGGGNVYEIGDGDLTTEARLVTSFGNWVRHLDRGGFVLITLNADGIMEQTRDFDWGQNGDTRMTLNGGTFISSGAIRGLATRANSIVGFDAPGSSFTAPFGDGEETDFPDLAAVDAAIGDSLVNNTDESLSTRDNGDGTFTVSSGGSLPTGGEMAITSITFTGGVATIEITGRDGVDYWLAGSSDLITFVSPQDLFSNPELDNALPNPFQTTDGTVRAYLDASEVSSRFFRIQDIDPAP